jgi:hypothetical protein
VASQGAYHITGAADLRRLADQLRAEGRRDLRDQLGQRLRGSARPLRDDLRSAIVAVPIRGSRARGSSGPVRARPSRSPVPVRATIAAAITATAILHGNTAGARVFIDYSKIPPKLRPLPKHINSGRWRHPTFGHSPWTTQYGREWWWPTIRPHMGRINADTARILSEIETRLARG